MIIPLNKPASMKERTTISHCARLTTGERMRVTGPKAGTRAAWAKRDCQGVSDSASAFGGEENWELVGGEEVKGSW